MPFLTCQFAADSPCERAVSTWPGFEPRTNPSRYFDNISAINTEQLGAANPGGVERQSPKATGGDWETAHSKQQPMFYKLFSHGLTTVH